MFVSSKNVHFEFSSKDRNRKTLVKFMQRKDKVNLWHGHVCTQIGRFAPRGKMSQVFSVHARKGWNSIRKTFISRITICGTNKGKNKSSPLRPIISFKARVADESKHYFRANDVNRVNCVVCPIMALQRLTNIVRLVDPRNFF